MKKKKKDDISSKEGISVDENNKLSINNDIIKLFSKLRTDIDKNNN